MRRRSPAAFTPVSAPRLYDRDLILPANAFAFDGAGKGWRHMFGERLGEVLAEL